MLSCKCLMQPKLATRLNSHINSIDAVNYNRKELFRSSFGVTVGHGFFVQLTKALKYCTEILPSELSNSNVLDQYQLYVLIKLTACALNSIDKLHINLGAILNDKEELSDFLTSVERTTKRVTEITDEIELTKGGDYDDEFKSIWEGCNTTAKNIHFLILTFSSESDDTIVSKIDELVTVFENGDQRSSHIVFLKYLAMPSTLESICIASSTETVARLIRLFEVLAKKKTNKMIEHLSKLSQINLSLETLTLESTNPKFEYEEDELVAEAFMYAVAKRILIIVYSPYKLVVKAAIEGNTKKAEELEKQFEANTRHYNVVFDIISDCLVRIFTETTQATQACLKELLKVYTKGRVTDESIKENNNINMNKYLEFHTNLDYVVF